MRCFSNRRQSAGKKGKKLKETLFLAPPPRSALAGWVPRCCPTSCTHCESQSWEECLAGSLGNSTSGPAAAVTAVGTWILPHRVEWCELAESEIAPPPPPDPPSSSSSSSSLLPDGKLWEDVKLKPWPATLMLAPREHPSHRFRATWTCTETQWTRGRNNLYFLSFVPPRFGIGLNQ